MQREAEKEGSKIIKKAKLRKHAIFGELNENRMNKTDVKTVTTRR